LRRITLRSGSTARDTRDGYVRIAGTIAAGALFLVGLYESWTIPVPVLLSI
jgi:hypothetical protein